MYQRYFGTNQKSRYSLAHTAGFIGIVGTVIVFFSFLYNLYIDGETLYFYCNLGIFVLLMGLWIVLLCVTKRELAVGISKSNYILFLGFLMMAYNVMYGIKMYQAFQPSILSMEFSVILLYLFLDLFSAILLIINGMRSYRELSGRYTRIYRKIAWKRNVICLAGIGLGILLGLFIRIAK